MGKTKRLYRSDSSKVFAGIMGGLGEYFGVDPAFVRLIGLIILIFSGVVPALLVYFLALFIIPRRPSTTEE